MANNGAMEYERMGVATVVDSASPHELIDMLFVGAQQRLIRARGCVLHNDIPGRADAIGAAVDIIDGLQASLDAERGGELASNLDALYDYMQRRLFRANMDNDADPIDEVLGLVDTLRSAWVAIGPTVKEDRQTA